MSMSMPVDNGASEKEVESGSGAAVVSNSRAVPMVRCNAMTWTKETEGLKVLVTRNYDPVAGTTVTTEEKAIVPQFPRMPLTGTAAERRYMERQWLWQAVPRVGKRESRSTARAVDSGGGRCQAPVQGG
jgi:hypothetical protein